jgi:GNAT superfamily N-acetyltransferase
MAACVEPLTLTERDLEYDIIVVAMDASAMAGMAQLGYVGDCMEVDMLFVDPVYIGSGCGRVLMNWCQTTALALGHSRLRIEADPGAVGFYERMGAVRIGEAPSNAIEGRMLPLLEWSLSAEIP